VVFNCCIANTDDHERTRAQAEEILDEIARRCRAAGNRD
jgi:hypothetical protein